MQGTRRSFIGSVIGTLVATQMPFVAEEAQYEVPRSPRIILDERYLDRFRLVVHGNQEEWWAPSVSVEEKGVSVYAFRTEDMVASVPLIANCCSLVDHRGVRLRTKRFDRPIQMNVWDVLRLHYTLDGTGARIVYGNMK